MKRILYAGIVLLILAASGGYSGETSVRLLPAVTAFLDEHTEFGTAVDSETVSNWSNGERQRVRFDSGRSLLFYTEDDVVVTVYEEQVGSGRVKIWGEYAEPPDPKPVARNAEGDLPDYRILFVIEKFDGSGRFGDVLIPSLSRATPITERERVTRQIAAKENIRDLSIYSTESAYKANGSQSYAMSHPEALRQGFLGMLRDGKFTPGEEVFP